MLRGLNQVDASVVSFIEVSFFPLYLLSCVSKKNPGQLKTTAKVQTAKTTLVIRDFTILVKCRKGFKIA